VSDRPAHGDGAPPRHPRLAARRRAVARASGRRRLRRVVAGVTVAAAAAGGFAALHSPLFAARHVRVVGAVHTPVAEVLAVTGLAKSPPLIDVDPAGDAAALRRLAWVGSAAVRREWPDAVTVSVSERRPVAVLALGSHGGFLLADASGRVLATTLRRPAGLLEVLGPTGPARPGAQLPAADRPLLDVAAGLPASLDGAIRAVLADPGGGIDLRLAAGPLVLLGQPGDPRRLAEQAVAIATLLAKVPMRAIMSIDLRVPDSPVLTP
jgi:cell division protein FtsQ